MEGGTATAGHQQEGYRSTCPKCGAHRIDRQIGLEETPEAYVAQLVGVFREVKRVLKDDGVLWVNIGDSYWGGKGASSQAWSTEHQDRDTIEQNYHQICGKGETRPTDRKHETIKPKDLIGIPWMLAFALRADGWYLRSEIIWAKPNPMPESVTDRPTKSHEQIFLFSKSPKYFYDAEAIKEQSTQNPADWNPDGTPKRPSQVRGDFGGKNILPGKEPFRKISATRNKRDVWTVSTKPYREAHFATYPPDLIEPCILAGTSEKGECPKCGKPWERIVQDNTVKAHDGQTESDYPTGTTANRLALLRQAARERGEEYSSARVTIGWQPSCNCSGHFEEVPMENNPERDWFKFVADREVESPVPQTVLDPFNGSGTSGYVAVKHGRNYVGIDLNPDYLVMTRKRISNVQQEFA